MYIGPWQEYKLAQVIKVKNDLYEGNSENQAFHPRTHDSLNQSCNSHVSTPSTRTFSSEPIQKIYPKFAIDRYYEQWRKVEHLMSQPNDVHKKPPLPKLDVRRRQGKSIQEKRINRMRFIYGINKPPEPEPPKTESKISFVDKLKNKVKESEKVVKEFKEDERKKVKLEETTRDKEKKQERGGSGAGERAKEEEKVAKFSSLAVIPDLDALEESLNHDGVDGLLQWVEELPDEVSSTMKDYRDGKSREGIII